MLRLSVSLPIVSYTGSFLSFNHLYFFSFIAHFYSLPLSYYAGYPFVNDTLSTPIIQNRLRLNARNFLILTRLNASTARTDLSFSVQSE